MGRSRFSRRVPLLPERGRRFSVDFGDQARVTELRVWLGHVDVGVDRAWWKAWQGTGGGTVGEEAVTENYMAPIAIQLAWVGDDGEEMVTPPIGAAPRAVDGSYLRHDDETVLDPDEVIVGLSGTRAWGLIASIALVTQRRTHGFLGTDVGAPFGSTLDRLSNGEQPVWTMPGGALPADSLVSGLVGSYLAGRFVSLGLRCSVAGIGPAPATAGDGRVVSVLDNDIPSQSAEEHPRSARSIALDRANDGINPNFRRREVWRVDQWDDELMIRSNDRTERMVFDVARWDEAAGRRVDVYAGSDGAVHVYPPTATAAARIERPGAVALVEPVVACRLDPGSPGWSNVFSIDHRPGFLAFAFNGVNVARLNPLDLQSAEGAIRQRIFTTPDSNGGFHVGSESPMLVPNGWQLVMDRSGRTAVHTESASGGEELRRTWATNLGISGSASGFGAEVAFQHNESAKSTMAAASEASSTTMFSQAMTRDHTLVIDLATVRLDPAFRTAVDELAGRPSPELAAEFLARFGVHFCFAVTYGSTTTEHQFLDSSKVSASQESQTSAEDEVKASFSATVLGQGVGASAGVKSGESNDVSTSGWTEGSRGTTGTVTVGSDSHPVPILLDLEPVTTLLSPVFFDDPYVTDALPRLIESTLRRAGSWVFAQP